MSDLAPEQVSFIDSLYYTVITMTTVGYGDQDLLPSTAAQKIFCILFMVLGTAALAVCIGRVSMLLAGRRIYLTDFAFRLPTMMVKEAVLRKRMDPVLREDKFVLHVLVDSGLVESDTIDEIRKRFTELEGYGVGHHVGDGALDLQTLFDLLVRRLD